MLSLMRALGFLAPAAMAALVAISVAASSRVLPEESAAVAVMLAVAGAAGLTAMALLGAAFMGHQLNRIAAALERTLETEGPRAPRRSRTTGATPEA